MMKTMASFLVEYNFIIVIAILLFVFTTSDAKSPTIYTVSDNEVEDSKIHNDDDYFDLNYISTAREEFQTREGVNEQNPDIKLSTPELIERYGYPAEIHKVTTDDGYILTMHRIPYGKNNTIHINGVNDSRPIVFLQHGMFGTSADWILNSVNKSLAYMLAEAGYDVWLGNARGNTYSQAHRTLSIKRIKFWRFSWDEMGRYDLPAALDYILATTGRTNLSYIGHSMGTTMYFVLMSTKPEYNSKINFMGALGPAVYLNHGKGPAKYFAKYYGCTEKRILDVIGHGIFLPKFLATALRFIGPRFCTGALRADKLCSAAMFLFAGHDPAQTNYTQLPVILAHDPTSVSTQTAFHYFQIIRSGEFTMYDHGKGNKKVYGTHSPPKYDLSKVVTPVALFWGQNDILCVPMDVARLAALLPNITLNHRVDFHDFNHIDFIFAKDVDILVNKHLIEALAKHN